MTAVFGTRVHAVGADHAAALLISDLHVPAHGGDVLERLRGALAAAQRLGAPVFVLGDLFDSYVCRAQVRHGVWGDVAAMFKAAAVPVALLHGNRDFLLGPEFAAASGARVVDGGLRGRLGGADTLLLHGDELCRNDLPYQRAKRWLRQPLVKWLVRALPLRAALAIAERARNKSRMVVQGGDQQRFLPPQSALDVAFASGAPRLVFGHIHWHAHARLAAGEYWVLPAFDTTAIGLLLRGGGVEPVRFVDAAGTFEPSPVPPPCPFPP